ncbi:MAG: type II toxin-antitoxin system Phd/YefM family antitoxin [Pseudomonadota bacterium]|nr:type II toxin-antitoxin system Phd/YefM family antitoxin [Pseudomonadota bacterium]
MNNLTVQKDIVPIGDFKASLPKYLKNAQNTGHPLIITQNGRPAGVLLSPSEYDKLTHNRSFLKSLNQGLTDCESGSVYSTTELRAELIKKRSLRGSE